MNINKIKSVIMEEVDKDIRDKLYNKSVSVKEVQEYTEAVSKKVDKMLKELKAFELK